MAYTKPTDINSLWAASGTKVAPETSKRSLGWVAEKPSWQYFNSLTNRSDLIGAYLNERGMPEWDSVTEYLADKSYTVGSDGFIYKARLTQSGNDPLTDDGTNWRLISNELGNAEWNVNYDYLVGSVIVYSDKLWIAKETSTGVTPTTTSTEWDEFVTYIDIFKNIYAALYTSGVSTSIGVIYSGVEVSSYSYMIYPDDGRLYDVNSATGVISGDFDPSTGVDSGVTGVLLSVSLGNSSQLDIATATEITTGTESKVVTADELADSGILNQENEGELYTISNALPNYTSGVIYQNDSGYKKTFYLNSGAQNQDPMEVSKDGVTFFVVAGANITGGGSMTYKASIKAGWYFRFTGTMNSLIEESV